MGGTNKKKTHKPKFPFVSICTPTFNRRPFIPIIIKCIENQTYPKDRFEWIIVDDGTDKIEDLVAHIPYVKYYKYDTKMTLGKKRNITNEKATGSILVYMDDDDYYPPERISHAVERLSGSNALCAGSSAMFIYFKHINKMYQFGPYGPNHATAATFAFKRELLTMTRFNEESCVAEEKQFLKDYSIPFVQLDSSKSILVFSHNHNSFDKKELLAQLPNPYVHESALTPSNFVKDADTLQFFMKDINTLLDNYEPGNSSHKPDVKKQLDKLKIDRERMAQEQMKHHQFQQNSQKILQDQHMKIQQLNLENTQLKDQVEYLNNKIKQLIMSQITKKREEQQGSL
jgi:glycosyltransferase involved in cell wall biosynthesis